MPCARNASAVAEPTAATCTPCQALLGIASWVSRSAKIATPLTLVRINQSNAANCWSATSRALRSGSASTRIVGISSGVAPKAVRASLKLLACSWARVTTMRLPCKGEARWLTPTSIPLPAPVRAWVRRAAAPSANACWANRSPSALASSPARLVSATRIVTLPSVEPTRAVNCSACPAEPVA